MDTFFAKNRLSAFLDGALPDGEAAEVADAIERDPALKAEYEQLRMAVAALRRHGPVSAPEGFFRLSEVGPEGFYPDSHHRPGTVTCDR